MTAFRRRILVNTAKFFDLAIMSFSFGLASVLVAFETPATSIAAFFSMRVKVQNFALFAGFLALWHLIFVCLGLYDSKRLSTRAAEIRDVFKATALASAALFIAATALRIVLVTPRFVLFFWCTSFLAAASSRLVVRHLLGRIRKRGRNLRNMLVVGTNARAVRFARKIETQSELGYRVLGFVDDAWEGLTEFRKAGYPWVSDFHDFPNFLREHEVDEVVVGLPMESSYAQASRIVARCGEQGITVRLLPDLFDTRIAQSTAEQFEGEAVITLYTGYPDGWQHLIKRTLDVAISLLTIALLAPLLLLTVTLIKFTTSGPVLFVQERVGLGKRRFRLFKFRTMVPDAENQFHMVQHLNEASGPVFKLKNDPRITPLGKLLRKASIDELPQLFNVLKGDMSLVGPRPLPVRDYKGFDQDWQRRRFSVRPGITCLWQINGRSAVSFEHWMHLDMEYIDNWSLGLDMKILAKTIPAVLKGTGAA